MKPIWFKAKRYGWGWYPATWQGWTILLGWIALMTWNVSRIDLVSHSESDALMALIPETLILVVILVVICWLTGETPRWRWGK